MQAFSQEAKSIQRQISELAVNERYRLQPRLAGLLGQMRAAGYVVPIELYRLHDELTDEAIEAQFDNMPV